jgi:hypothetical protein
VSGHAPYEKPATATRVRLAYRAHGSRRNSTLLAEFPLDGWAPQARRGILYWETLPNGSGEEAKDGEQLPASYLHFYTLYFFQESVVFLNNGALKSTLAPAQWITGIISYWGMEMLIFALLDELNHIIDGHSNLLSDIDAAARLKLRLPIGRNKGRIRRARGEG